MDRDVDHQPLIRPSGDDRHQDQVAGGTDRQELGDSLDKGENDYM
jgi:hypothetical protein